MKDKDKKYNGIVSELRGENSSLQETYKGRIRKIDNTALVGL